MGLNTQQDPIGIAGGLNLYGYAGGDPINFSDPFGLCTEDDEICLGLMVTLRGVEGDAFQNAADAFDAYGGRVILRDDWPGDMRSSSEDLVQVGTRLRVIRVKNFR